MGDLQFIITSGAPGKHTFSEQKRDTVSRVEFADGSSSDVRISGEAKDGSYRFVQTLATDPANPVLRIKTRIEWSAQPNGNPNRVFILFKPALRNTGNSDRAWVTSDYLAAEELKIANERFPSAGTVLLSDRGWLRTSAGVVGVSDGWQQLKKTGKLTDFSKQAGPDSVALTGELEVPAGDSFEFELTVGFGPTARDALRSVQRSEVRSFEQIQADYNRGWEHYLSTLKQNSAGAAEILKEEFLKKSALILKMHEDKQSPGALVASLSKPGIPDADRSQEGTGGYHLVWPRDLYHSAMGLLAVGDQTTALQVLKYLAQSQKKDGSWSQNYWIDGTPYWQGLQLDEVAFPILLAGRLMKEGAIQTPEQKQIALTLVKKAANFIVQNGPYSPQDRWEEIGGYIPSTLAAQVAALWIAADLLGDLEIQRIAANWDSQIERWTTAPRGSPYGEGYFVRSSPSGTPSLDEILNLANGAGSARAVEIIDGGFLELVRLGIRSPGHPAIQKTLEVYDSFSPEVSEASDVRYSSSVASAHRRYNRDFYGESREGGFWPLLAGERGMYALMNGDRSRAIAQLRLMQAHSLPSGMIPEQTTEAHRQTSVGKGVACPLAWAHAEALVLARSLVEGTSFDRPEFSKKTGQRSQ